MIEHLLLGWSAYFFSCAKPIDDNAIETLFAKLPTTVDGAGSNLLEDVRKTVDGKIYSAICFPYKRTPSFFSAGTSHKDLIHGFMLIVEDGDYIAILKSGLEIPATFKQEWLRRLGASAVEQAVATADAKFETMRLRAMSTSKRTLRTKTFEADDLENAMPMASASRYVSQSYRLRRGSDRYTATPTTGRIAKSSDRSGYVAAIDWSISVMTALRANAGAVAPFIQNFARPVDLSSLSVSTNPTNFAIDVAELSDRLFANEPLIKLVHKLKPGQFVDLARTQSQAILDALDQGFVVSGPRDKLEIFDTATGSTLGRLRWGKSRLALSTFALSQAEDIYIAPTDHTVGDDQRIPLKMYIDREDLFLVLFDDVSVAYLHGELFQDKAMQDGGSLFLSHLIADACLQTTTSEKGGFRKNQRKFSPTSVFGQVVTKIAQGDDVLICDDLGDEWADFIGLNTQGTPPMISFYHAKHGARSLGASPFHISVSQAEKNLGRLTLPAAAIESKFDSWISKPYENEKTVTAIKRLMRGGSRHTIEAKISALRNSPDVVRRICIVTSSLSRKDVEDTFAIVQTGGRPSAHFVQLYWLLSSFFSACAEVGAIGYVICQP